MTQTITYADTFLAPAWSETVTGVRRQDMTLVESADRGYVGTGSLLIDDPTMTAGHGTDDFRGLKPLWIENDAMSPSRIFTGLTDDRVYRRGPYRDGSARQISVSLNDANVLLGLRAVSGTDGNRPAETVADRMTWILGSSYAGDITDDAGWVETYTDQMDANDYRGQFFGDVVADCAMAVSTAAVNWWVRWDDYTGSFVLWFADSNTSTAFESSLRISNVIADEDGITTFYPSVDAELRRTPDTVASGALGPYQNGMEYRTRAATADRFITRDRVAPNANVKQGVTMAATLDRFLRENRSEDDRIGVTIEVPEAAATDVQAGMRIQAKFSHFRAYQAFTWFRIVTTTKTAIGRRGHRWRIVMELVPQEDLSPGGVVQSASNESDAFTLDLNLPSPVTSGHLMVIAYGRRNSLTTDPPPTTLEVYLQSDLSPATGHRDFTLFPGAYGRTRNSDVFGVDYCGLYYRVATGDEQQIRLTVSGKLFATVWELRGVGATDAEILAEEFAFGMIHNLGTFAATGAVQLMVLIVDHSDGTVATSTPGTGWTEDYDTNQGPFNDGHPEFVTMHGTAATDALATGTFGSEWAGAAVNLAEE